LAALLYQQKITTPLGEMLAVASDRGLAALEFTIPSRMELWLSRKNRWFNSYASVESHHPHIDAAQLWLASYFKGDFKNLSEVVLDLRGSPFELATWRKMLQIPLGLTWTYSEMAKHLRNPRSCRAVGNSSRRNPVSLIVPCHRVIGSNGQLTGYGGGLSHKAWLLNHEFKCSAFRPPVHSHLHNF
jgi:O-6-methylguanine DNA methyltransferase